MRSAPRLYLVTPPVEDARAFATVLTEAMSGADIAAVLLRFAEADEIRLIERARLLAPAAQSRGAAFLLDGHADLVARCHADGAHLTGIAALNQAIGTLKPDLIAGTGGLTTRHDAMLAGEAGADYVLFGEPDSSGHRPGFAAVIERVAWWAEVFEIPCVGYAGAPDEVAPLAAAGADFVALGDWVWSAESGPAAAVVAASAHLGMPERVA